MIKRVSVMMGCGIDAYMTVVIIKEPIERSPLLSQKAKRSRKQKT